MPQWKQHEITLPAFRRGCHLVTDQILREIGPSLKNISVVGMGLWLRRASL